MPKIISPNTSQGLLDRLHNAYPHLHTKPSNRFSFRPPATIYYDLNDPNFPLLILHEFGHALSCHHSFSTHIERLKCEREAWDIAHKLCQQFSVRYDTDFVEDQLDSYRDWLHAKSKCQKCGLTRYQTGDGRYHCPYCND